MKKRPVEVHMHPHLAEVDVGEDVDVLPQNSDGEKLKGNKGERAEADAAASVQRV
jgi:hypothetical protein